MFTSRLLGVYLSIILCANFVFPQIKLEKVQQFEGEMYFGGEHFDSTVDLDGNLIAGFSNPGVVMINEKGMKIMFPYGQGPDDIDGWYMFYVLDTGELVIEADAGKLKIFEKIDGTYHWKKTIWKQRWEKGFRSKDGVLYDKKWFFSGFDSNYRPGDKEFTMYYMRIYSDEGKFIKRIQEEAIPEPRRFHLLRSYVSQYKGKIYFLIENRMAVDVIDPNKLEREKRVALETPKFYKPLPDNFFRFQKNPAVRPINTKDLKAELQEFRTGYSRISIALIVNDWLVVQLRTCRDDMKNYVLLFYNAETLKLEQTIPTDDFLMASRNDRLYFFKGGHPTYDEVEKTAFVTYQVVKK